MSKHNIVDAAFVVCPYCSQKFEVLNFYHLKTHRKNLSQVTREFPGLATATKKYIENLYQTKTKKARNTCHVKYGGPSYLSSKEGKKKFAETNLRKYGCEHPFQSKEVKEKIEQTCTQRYGARNPQQSKRIREKTVQTNLEKYGVTNTFQLSQARQRAVEVQSSKFTQQFNEYLQQQKLELVEPYSHAKESLSFRCQRCGSHFHWRWNDLQQHQYRCHKCFPKVRRGIQNEILQFLLDLNLTVRANDRKLINPFEVDFYLPEKNIAIEFHGLFWHSEKGLRLRKSKTNPSRFHLMKTELANSQGIHLIQIFEDEWILRSAIVKSRLKQILGVHSGNYFAGRKCVVREIDTKTKNAFLNEHHLQGADKSKVKLGAFYQDQLVAVMTFAPESIAKGGKKKRGGVWELSRYCTACDLKIPGIASKLLKTFQRANEWSHIFSYADRRWSNGSLYRALGFQFEKFTPPNYWYFKANSLQRIHRFNLRKKKDEDPEVPEAFLRQTQGYERIWDCGHFKFGLRR